MKTLAFVLVAWLAVSYVDGDAPKVSPSPIPPTVIDFDCHCLIEPNHGLIR